jgi:hypothetical protein
MALLSPVPASPLAAAKDRALLGDGRLKRPAQGPRLAAEKLFSSSIFSPP